MSCIPATPSTDVIRSTALVAVANLDVTNSLTTGEAVNDTVLEFVNLVDRFTQAFELRQVRFREVASSSGNIRKPDLALALYHGTPPTAPSPNTVYSTPVGSTYLCTVYVAEADWKRVNDTTWEAIVRPNIDLISSGSGTTPNLYGVVLSAEASGVTFASGAALSVGIVTQLHNQLSKVV